MKRWQNACLLVQDSWLDELKQIKLNLLTSRYDKSKISLTIAPSMDCNFACSYCFEKNQLNDKQMSPQVVDQIVDFVKSKAGHLEYLDVTWFGGEPLLAVPHIEEITKRLVEICKSNKIAYDADIITNGYFLTTEVAEKLKSCYVSRVQITIDGTKDTHDKRRPLINGEGTFDRIMHNIEATKNIIPILVRINVDKENTEQLSELMHFFSKRNLLSYIQPYLGHVKSYNDEYESTICLSNKGYSRLHLEFMKENNLSLMNRYPRPRGCCCIADHVSSVVIDTQGYIYKCTNDIGMDSKKIFSLGSENVVNSSMLHEYLLYDPTEDLRCKNCKCLPICMGGCPHHRIQNWDSCRHKYALEEYLVECAKFLVESSAG